jgi:hypothetical protein
MYMFEMVELAVDDTQKVEIVGRSEGKRGVLGGLE